MADTLFNATLQTARRLGIVRGYKASATGSTTTLVDTVQRKEVDNYWNEGTIWITEDAGGASAAPEGEFSTITDFVQSTGTLTFGALTAATATSDKYAVALPVVPLDALIEMVNSVLQKVYVPTWDTTSLDTVSGQTEYTLPAAVHSGTLREVWVETQEDADDNQPQKLEGWRIKEAVAGTGDTLILNQYSDGWDIWLYYVARHAEVRDASDKIHEIIDLDGLAIHAALECLTGLMMTDSGTQRYEGLANRLMVLQRDYPVQRYKVSKGVRFNPIGSPRSGAYTGEVGKVRL